MKGLNFFEKFIFFANSLAAFFLLFAYVLPYIPPKSFSVLALLSLAFPALVILNILFLIYWLLRLKKQLLLSLIVLACGFNYITSIYKFTSNKTVTDSNSFSVMNYNVRLFNQFNWLPNKNVESDILAFIKKENPDIISFQEYKVLQNNTLKDYRKYEYVTDGKVKDGLAIYTKYPIVNSGVIDFPKSSNNAIFTDVVKGKDTIRVYNIHLQSSRISTDVSSLKKEGSEKLTRRLGAVFKKQQEQAELILKHKSACKYKTIIMGDFNNTAFSYVYNTLKSDNFIDAFDVAGTGFGTTFNFNIIPLRIDFILVDKKFAVNGFKSYNIKLSDHYPVNATLQ